MLSFCQAIGQAVLGSDMSKVSGVSRARFIPHHGDHVDGLLLLRQARRRCLGNQVSGIGAHVKLCLATRYIHPESLEELTRSETFLNEFRYGRGQDGSLDLLALVVD